MLPSAKKAASHVNFTGGLHLFLQAVEYVRITTGVTFGTDTPHLITDESPCNTSISGSSCDLTNSSQVNPNYNAAFDGIGHRLRGDNCRKGSDSAESAAGRLEKVAAFGLGWL